VSLRTPSVVHHKPFRTPFWDHNIHEVNNLANRIPSFPITSAQRSLFYDSPVFLVYFSFIFNIFPKNWLDSPFRTGQWDRKGSVTYSRLLLESTSNSALFAFYSTKTTKPDNRSPLKAMNAS
jgi:hypothetical protein